MRRLLIFGFAAGALAVACSLLGSDENLSNGDAARDDGSTATDAREETPLSETGSDGSLSGDGGVPSDATAPKDVMITADAEAPFDGSCVTPASSLMLWLRADSISGSPGTPVALWPDHSGNGRDFSQTVAGSMPTFAPNAINGQPAVGFGASAYLALDHNASQAFKFIPGADLTMAIVAFAEESGDYAALFGNEDPNVRQGFQFSIDRDSGQPAFGVRSTCCPAAWFDASAYGAWHQLLGSRSGATVSLYVDGVKGANQASGATAPMDNAADLWIGKAPVNGYLKFVGSVAEILVWSKALDAKEQACVTSALRARYGLP